MDESGNEVTLLGTCRRVSINGNNNDLGVEAAGAIVINGNNNEITYRHSPHIIDNDEGNTAVLLESDVGGGDGG